MAFTPQEQEIIQYGLANGKSRQEVTQAISNSRAGITPEPKAPVVPQQSILADTVGDFAQIGTDIARSSQNRADTITDLRSKALSGEKGQLSASFQEVGQLAGAGADAIGAVFKGGVKMVLGPKSEAAVKGLVGQFGQAVMENKEVQGAIKLYNSLPPEAQDNIDAVGGIVSLASEFFVAGGAKRAGVAVLDKTKDAASTVATGVKQGTKELTEGTFELGKQIVPKSPDIMNRVARLTPTQARKFKQLAGETHGEYLTRTGNFGNPQKIVETEAVKFAQSIKSVDDTLDSLQGTFKTGVIDDVLEGLQKKVAETSTTNVPSPLSAKVAELVAKNADEGLTMTDINVMKRLYEREVKLGFNKVTAPANDVTRATNIDNALREWQVAKAEELGFTNLRELNKQTQISRNLIDSLGDQLVGKTGLNSVSLTDWILLSGGDPTAVGGLIMKKFFGSQSVQARIAEMLSDVVPVGVKKPILTPSKQVPPPQSKILQQKPLPPTVPPRSPKVKGKA